MDAQGIDIIDINSLNKVGHLSFQVPLHRKIISVAPENYDEDYVDGDIPPIESATVDFSTINLFSLLNRDKVYKKNYKKYLKKKKKYISPLPDSYYLLNELLKFHKNFSLSSFSQTAEEYFNRGNAKSDLEDYDGAISDYTKVIELIPDYADAYYNRGFAKASLDDNIGAISDFTKVIELNPDDADAYYNRGLANGVLIDFSEACKDARKANKSHNIKGL